MNHKSALHYSQSLLCRLLLLPSWDGGPDWAVIRTARLEAWHRPYVYFGN